MMALVWKSAISSQNRCAQRSRSADVFKWRVRMDLGPTSSRPRYRGPSPQGAEPDAAEPIKGPSLWRAIARLESVFRSSCGVAGIGEVIGTFLCGDLGQQGADARPEIINGAFLSLS
jgi:hypothetical protein